MQNNYKKYILIGLTGLVLLALGVFIYAKFYKNTDKISIQEGAVQNTSVESTDSNAGDQQSASSENPSTAEQPVQNQKPSYDSVVEDYKRSGYRIQLSKCSGIPGKMNIKQGTKFMIDNRDGEAHTIKIASVTKRVEAYDYEIIVAPKYGSYNLTCDGKGSAELNVYP